MNPMKLLAFLTGYSIIATVIAAGTAAQFSEVQGIISERNARICQIDATYCK